MKDSIIVSIIIPCYNQANYLPVSLESVLKQTYPNWECIIVNDGATDNTKQIAEEWCEKDDRFKYIEKENGGLSSARNAGLNIASGDYIQFLDADDCLMPTKFEDSLNKVMNSQKSIVVVSNFAMFEDFDAQLHLQPYCTLSEELLNYKNILNKWDINFSIPIHCGFFPKNLFDTIRFNETLRAKEDWLFWIQVSQTQISFIYLDKTLALYRRHALSMTMTSEKMFSDKIRLFKEFAKYMPNEEYIDFLTLRLEDNFKYIENLKEQNFKLKKSKFYQLEQVINKLLKKIKS